MLRQPKQPGDVIHASDYNDVLRRASAAFNGAAGHGVRAAITPGGIALSAGDQTIRFTEPAVAATAVNVGSHTVGIFDAVQLTWPSGLQGTDPYDGQPLADFLDDRVLEVRRPIATGYGRWGVACETIEPGDAGRVWIAGVCLARLAANPNAYMDCDRVDTLQDSFDLVPTPLGGGQALWMNESDGWVVVRIGHRQTDGVPVQEEGSNYWGIGEVLVLRANGANLTITELSPGVVKLEATL